jgi:hypothetical protein
MQIIVSPKFSNQNTKENNYRRSSRLIDFFIKDLREKTCSVTTLFLIQQFLGDLLQLTRLVHLLDYTSVSYTFLVSSATFFQLCFSANILEEVDN